MGLTSIGMNVMTEISLQETAVMQTAKLNLDGPVSTALEIGTIGAGTGTTIQPSLLPTL